MRTNPDSTLFVVGVGASAGGLEALKHLFEGSIKNGVTAYVIVQHLSPDFKSSMRELIEKTTELDVVDATNNCRIEPDKIYITPPGVQIKVALGRLNLEPLDRTKLNFPINTFFYSLAEDFKDKSIAVVLSGTGSDGSKGIAKIKEMGGLTIVQIPSDAKFDGMPNEAIDTGGVNIIAKASHIRAEIQKYIDFDFAEDEVPIGPELAASSLSHIEKIFALIKDTYQADLYHYKPNTIFRRIRKRISTLQFKGFDEYYDYLIQDPSELDKLFNDLMIPVTQFFRDPELFKVLAEDALPEKIRSKDKNSPLRIWSIGCSAGHEAYSLAMLATQICKSMGRANQKITVFATDITPKSIEIASTGTYSENDFNMIPKEIEPYQFFVNNNGQFTVNSRLRSLLVFSVHNIFSDPPFTNVDIVVCRNMMIYLKPEAQRQVLRNIHFSINHKGILVLGPSESLMDLASDFETINSRWRIFSKSTDRKFTLNLKPAKQPDEVAAASLFSTHQKRDLSEVEQVNFLFEHLVENGIVLDRENNVTHVYGAGDIIVRRLFSGKIELNISKVQDADLRIFLESLIKKAREENQTVTSEPVTFQKFKLQFKAIHLKRKSSFKSDFDVILILHLADENSLSETPAKPLRIEDSAKAVIHDLENELTILKSELQNNMQELESTNEELQSTNQELLSSNEELQSTNEELNSVNEELHVLNTEYQEKIKELVVGSTDINHIFKIVEIGIIFIDRQYKVRRFNFHASKLINLRNGDEGRYITEFSSEAKNLDLISRIRDVVGGEVERVTEKIVLADNSTLLLRIHPYINQSGERDGCVLSFFDEAAFWHGKKTES